MRHPTIVSRQNIQMTKGTPTSDLQRLALQARISSHMLFKKLNGNGLTILTKAGGVKKKPGDFPAKLQQQTSLHRGQAL